MLCFNDIETTCIVFILTAVRKYLQTVWPLSQRNARMLFENARRDVTYYGPRELHVRRLGTGGADSEPEEVDALRLWRDHVDTSVVIDSTKEQLVYFVGSLAKNRTIAVTAGL